MIIFLDCQVVLYRACGLHYESDVFAVCAAADELDSKRMSLTTKSRYSLAENSLKTCEDLVLELMHQDDAWPFLKPVTRKEVNVCYMKYIYRVAPKMTPFFVCLKFIKY